MGNTTPRLKLHYIKEEQSKEADQQQQQNNGPHKKRIVSGLVQILDLPKGTKITDLDVYVIGREKISWYPTPLLPLLCVKETHTFYKEKITITLDPQQYDTEPTFQIPIPNHLPNSGHGGNYGKGCGYAIGYHILVEAQDNTDISDTAYFSLGLTPSTTTTTTSASATPLVKDTIKLGIERIDYEIPKEMSRGTHQMVSFCMPEGSTHPQMVRIRLREEGRQLKGAQQTISEIKFEVDDQIIPIGPDNKLTISMPISKYINAPLLDGTCLHIRHVLELTAIGGSQPAYVNIPVTLL